MSAKYDPALDLDTADFDLHVHAMSHDCFRQGGCIEGLRLKNRRDRLAALWVEAGMPEPRPTSTGGTK